MQRTVLYECTLCGNRALATVHGLIEPNGLFANVSNAPRDTQAFVERESVPPDEAFLNASVREIMTYCICPHCRQRNPSGLERLRNETRNVRVFTIATFAVIALLAWFSLWIAYTVGTLAVLLALHSVVFALRKKVSPVRHLITLASALALSALAVRFYPRALASWPALVVLTALFRKNLGAEHTDGENAKRMQARISFENVRD